VVPILVLLLCKRRDDTKNVTHIKYKGRSVDFFTMFGDDNFVWLCGMIFF